MKVIKLPSDWLTQNKLISDWFMKADDDTFVVVENLKHLLSNYSTNDPIHFGHNFKYLGVESKFIDAIFS